MNIFSRRKLATFKTLHRAEKPSHELIITHPFRNARLKHFEDVVESWARSLASVPNNRWNIRIYSFDAYEIFESGPDAFDAFVSRLKQKLIDLECDFESPLYQGSKHGSTYRDSTAKTSPPIVFVAHSLGTWVVKKLTGLIGKIAGFVFLDAEIRPSKEDYVHYLIKLTKLCAMESVHPQRLDELCESLQNFDDSLGVEDSRSKDTTGWGQYKSSLQSKIVHELVWMTENVNSHMNQTDKPQWLNRGLRLRFAGLRPHPSRPSPGETANVLAAQHLSRVDEILRSIVANEVDQQRQRTKELATSFFRTGEFHNARRLFSLLDKQGSSLAQGQIIHVRLNLAQTFLYTGEYREAWRRLQSVQNQIETVKSSQRKLIDHHFDISLDVDRWLAVAAIFLGDYNDAAVRLLKLLPSWQHTLSSEPETHSFFIEVKRDLGLAYAHLGRYSQAEAMLNEVDQEIEKGHFASDAPLKPMTHSVKFVRATLNLVLGDLSEAMENSKTAWMGLQEQLGRYHFQTLECASLRIRTLAYMSEFDSAQPMCDALIGDMSRELGRSHPLTLGAVEILVYILRSKSRFAEALETARSLYNRTENCLGAKHPQTLRAGSHVAATNFELGNYKTAEREITQVITICEQNPFTGGTRPDVLDSYVLKARILNKTEKPQEAFDVAMRTLEDQLVLYGKAAARPKRNSPKIGSLARPLTPTFKDNDKHDFLVELAERIFKDMERNPKGVEWKPAIISSLEVIADILNHPQNDQLRDLNPAKIMEVVVNYRRVKLGHRHLDTLRSERLLALAARNDQSQNDNIDYASDALYDVWSRLKEKFGQSHPLTLSVEREILVTDCMRAVWEKGGPARRQNMRDWELLPSPNDPKRYNRIHSLTLSQWEDVEYVSEEILHSQEQQLGPWHPDTLQSLFWLLQVRSNLRSMLTNSPEVGIHIDVETVQNDLLERLKGPNVAEERPHEALWMRALALEFSGEEESSAPVNEDVLLRSEKNDGTKQQATRSINTDGDGS